VGQREPDRRGPAHRLADQRRPLDAGRVEDGQRVGHQRVVGVPVGRGPARRAVPARVVGDHPPARALDRARAVHDVAPGGRQAVQQEDRRALARDLRVEDDPAALGAQRGRVGRPAQ
jgi:hypothetical protein